MSRILGLLLCLVAVALPWRLRVLYSEALGWVAQAYHSIFSSLLRFMLRHLREGEAWDKQGPSDEGAEPPEEDERR